ncbi:MAG TPA: DUF151 domain-containing protein [Mediterranea massiliensis]|uniref:Bifunctional nuclease family protein n=1 Tax=Mediterranea massiliensis TaxID=1841865 RepID=A0A921HXC1_9BACT|nr:bifunctional nuclease family protein [Mediterranea massiliensis]MBM6734102.1 bifunctional nuclease family protein [Mediterranea massiliensis]HJF92255.1 DUF151 domain-containing protein [Mediterranea massiliensis]
MNRKKTELQVLNISYSSSQGGGAYALVLGEVGGSRQMPVIIGAAEAQVILLEIRGIVSPRPLTHELFASVLEALCTRLLRILIYKAEKGLFYSYLYLQAADGSLVRVDARTSDAVALAMRMGCPILTYDDILEAECIRMDEGEAPEKREEQTLEEMQKELDKAIEQEEYEKAAALRDLINKMKDSNTQD